MLKRTASTPVRHWVAGAQRTAGGTISTAVAEVLGAAITTLCGWSTQTQSRPVASLAISGQMAIVRANETIGENNNGRTTPLASAANFTCANPAAVTPAPTSAPVNACVVEIGRPSREASRTVPAAARATAARKGIWV